jgi:hypothetical protein
MSVALVLVGALAIVLGVTIPIDFWRRHDAAARGRALRRVGFAVSVGFALLAGVFTAGEALDVPGGAAGVALVATWLAPAALLIALAAWAPSWSRWFFAVLTAVVLVSVVWSAVSVPAAQLMDRVGPVGAIAVFVLAAALGVLGLRQTRLAGALLLVVGLVPMVVEILGRGAGGQPLLVVSVPALVVGVLYLISARLTDRGADAAGQAGPAAPAPPGRGTSHARP